MGECKLDHSLEDVKQKFQQQKDFLSNELILLFEDFFQKEQSQKTLNEVFHLLKKYDLASKEDKEERSNKLNVILK